jgi:hypothetical protein
MFARLTLILVVFLGSFSSAFAQYSGTSQEQAACAPDARKLCSKVPQDEMTVLSCLVAQRAKLSQSCRQVLQRYGQIP